MKTYLKNKEFWKKHGKMIFLTVLLLVLVSWEKVTGASEVADMWYAPASSDNAVLSYENCIAITFDDGPQYKTTLELLDGLKERGVKATFFLLGEKVEERREVVERMFADGHLIGNHTYSHIQLSEVSEDVALAEIDRTNQIIADITGVAPTFIRPPFGLWSNRLEEKISMTPVLWTVDPCDWNTDDVGQIVNSVVGNVKNGDIILMHDIYNTSVAAALEIIDRLQAKGYVFVTVDELLPD